MRVCYFSEAYYAGHGGRTHAREFFGALERHPAVSTAAVVPLDVAPKREGTAIAGLRLPYHWRLFASFWLRGTKYYPRLRAYLQRRAFDWLILRATAYSTLMLSLLQRDFPTLRLALEVNASLFVEELHAIPLRRAFRRFEAMQFNRAERVICVSQALSEMLCEVGLDRRRLLVCHNGVNPEQFFPDPAARAALRGALGFGDDRIVLGYLGGMERFRDLPLLVDAVADMRAAGARHLALIFAGDGDDGPAVRARIDARRADLEGAVAFLGWLPYERGRATVAAFDIALFPFSQQYGSPQKLFEYLAAGKAVIGPDVAAVREVFRDGEQMLLVRDVGQLKLAIARLAADPGLRQRLGERGRADVLTRHTWSAVAERIVSSLAEDRCAS
ncbi:MAG: glycosyltransferase [Myxococcales bacterium]|nr:glycosyltransferase [Myxococcales bacterium]